MTIASALHTLEILPVAQEDGKMYDPSTVIVEGIVLCVVTYYATFITLCPTFDLSGLQRKFPVSSDHAPKNTIISSKKQKNHN